MVLFAIRCFFPAFAVRTRPGARSRATGLYVRTSIADSGRARIEVASIAESGDDRSAPPTPTKGRMYGGRAAAHGACTKWPDGVWYASVRSPPERGDFSAVVSHDAPLSASMEVIFWG